MADGGGWERVEYDWMANGGGLGRFGWRGDVRWRVRVKVAGMRFLAHAPHIPPIYPLSYPHQSNHTPPRDFGCKRANSNMI